MLILAIILLVIFIFAIYYQDVGILAPISFTLLSLVLMLWTVNFWEVKSQIVQFKEFNRTMQELRLNNDELEMAAGYMKITDWNEWLATQKFWNGTFFGDMVPDEVEELDRIN